MLKRSAASELILDINESNLPLSHNPAKRHCLASNFNPNTINHGQDAQSSFFNSRIRKSPGSSAEVNASSSLYFGNLTSKFDNNTYNSSKELDDLKANLKLKDSENEKLRHDNMILRTGLMSLNNKIESCKCTELKGLVTEQKSRIEYLELIAFRLNEEVKRLTQGSSGFNMGGRWEGKNDGFGDGHVF